MGASRSGTGTRWPVTGYLVVFALYLAGLLVWLVLGILPGLASGLPTLDSLLRSAAAGPGGYADLARQVLHAARMPQPMAWLVAEYLFSLMNLVLGLLLTWLRPRELVPRLLALAFIGTAGTFNEPSHEVFHLLGHAPVITAVHFSFHVISGTAYLWAVILFPDGRLPLRLTQRSRAVAYAAAGAGTALITWVSYRSSFIAHPPFFVAFFGVLVSVVGMAAQSFRLRRLEPGTPAWQQSRLLRIALTPALAVAVLWLLSQGLAHLTADRSGAMATHAATVAAWAQGDFPAVFAVVPATLVVAILRYRLWDIDLIVSRTLVLALLAGFVGLVYAAVLGLTGWAFRDSAWPAVVAMTAVGLAIEPVRQRCRALANTAVFGQQLSPREAMQALADHLSRPAPGDELTELTRVVVSGTRCTAAELWLVAEGELRLAAATSVDPPAEDRLPLPTASFQACARVLTGRRCEPVSHDGRLLAVLALTVPPGVSLPRAESALVRELAGHAGLLVANAQLTGDLARQVAEVSDRAAELARSRQSVVAAQDAARRRLERDLHDGAQQELVAVLIQLRAALDAADRQAGPPALLEPLRRSVERTRTTVRELCSGTRPEALERDGLERALQSAAGSASRAGLQVDVTCRLSRPLPQDTETAIYFCCVEALQNTVKHAHATHADVMVGSSADEVWFSVGDDGTGFDPSGSRRGAGLSNLVERLVDLGGTVAVESGPGKGTTTRARVPLPGIPASGQLPAMSTAGRQ